MISKCNQNHIKITRKKMVRVPHTTHTPPAILTTGENLPKIVHGQIRWHDTFLSISCAPDQFLNGIILNKQEEQTPSENRCNCQSIEKQRALYSRVSTHGFLKRDIIHFKAASISEEKHRHITHHISIDTKAIQYYKLHRIVDYMDFTLPFQY
jgi:hypothetical protein